MNKKGTSIGLIVISFIGIIVALALFTPIADTTGDMTNLRTVTNSPITTAAVNASTTLVGREATTAITVVNASDGTDWSDNFTVTTRNVAGSLAILLTSSQDAEDAGQTEQAANVTYSYKPQGYNNDSGSRGIVGMILIFAALTIMAFAYGPVREALGNIGIGN